MLLLPGQQRLANTTGLAEVSDLVQYYNAVEVVSRMETEYKVDSEVRADLESRLVNLYSLILEYQARTICQLSKNVIAKAYGARKGTWDGIVSTIQAAHLRCKERIDILDRSRLMQTINLQNSRINMYSADLRQRLDSLRETATESLKILNGQLDLSTVPKMRFSNAV